MSKCPYCEQSLTQVQAEDIAINAGRKSWNGVSYCCPHCRAVLSLQLDPIALKADIVRDLLAALRVKG